MREMILLIVPAIIGLSIVGVALYLVVANPGDEIPKIVEHSMYAVLGYWFGYAAGNGNGSHST